MKIAIHQPQYLPYYGLFQKIAQADIFVFLDNVQYSNNNWQNYNTIKTPQGTFRLKVPLKSHFGDKICDIQTRDELGWKEKHIKTLEMNYKKAAHFKEVAAIIFPIIKANHKSLADLNTCIICNIIKRIGITTKIVYASTLGVSGKKEKLVIDICKQLGATEYLSGQGASTYQKEEHFLEN